MMSEKGGFVYGITKEIPQDKINDYNFRRTIIKDLPGLASFTFSYIITEGKKTIRGKITGNSGFTRLNNKIDQTRVYLKARDDAKFKALRQTKKFIERSRKGGINIYEEVLTNTNIELELEDYKIRYNTKGIKIKTQNYKYKTKKGIKKYRFNIIRDANTGRIISRKRFKNERFKEETFEDIY